MTKIEDMTLEEKVGEILKYQRRFYHMAVARSISSILIFLILVILPIIGTYYFIDYINENISGLDEIKNLLQ